jgi:signal transduction histidine kinase
MAVFELHDNRVIWTGLLAAGWSLGLAGALGILLIAKPGRLDVAALRAIMARRLSEVAHRDFRMVRDIVEFPAFLRDREAMQIDSYRRRIEELRRDLAETTVPHLQATLDELAAAGYAPDGDASIRRGLGGIRRLLVDGQTTAFADPAGEPARRYDRLSRDLHTAFDHIYRDLHRLACIDGAPVVRTMLTRRAPELQQAGIDLHAAIPEADPEVPVLADAAQLGFIVDGLVANAMRAMSCDGRSAKRFEVRWRSRRNFVDLLVRDTGVGIAEDDRERIFTVTVESSGGSGFGLRRSREILRQWGGDLQLVDPQPERGAALRLTLRVFPPPRPHNEATS